jgi:hypothetical protein
LRRGASLQGGGQDLPVRSPRRGGAKGAIRKKEPGCVPQVSRLRGKPNPSHLRKGLSGTPCSLQPSQGCGREWGSRSHSCSAFSNSSSCAQLRLGGWAFRSACGQEEAHQVVVWEISKMARGRRGRGGAARDCTQRTRPTKKAQMPSWLRCRARPGVRGVAREQRPRQCCWSTEMQRRCRG